MMKKIKLPIDIKSLFFNIKNDNISGHTTTVASPLRKTEGDNRLDNILIIKNKIIDLSNKSTLVSLLASRSKSKILIKDLFVFDKLSVNGKRIFPKVSFGCFIKEEIDKTKVQFGRLKLHYPSMLIYEDHEVNINNKIVYKTISETLHNFAFLIRSFVYDIETEVLDFDALIVGENNIPYSKVFIIGKGVGNKFSYIFNENADDYDREIISLRQRYGMEINPYNYLDYFKKMKFIALKKVMSFLGSDLEFISEQFPYSLFDFIYFENNVRKYGILRVTSTKSKYFNLSLSQQSFMMRNSSDVKVFLVSDFFENVRLDTFDYKALSNLTMSINSMKYEED